MKPFLLIFTFILSMAGSANAQIKSGALLEGNIVTTDIKGNQVDVFKYLDEGKTVVIDVFATWCGPCWGFHTSGFLKNLHNQYGPGGTDQIRVIAIEADGATPESTLYNSSFGDWTAGVPYSIVNDHTFNSILKVAFFPTLYIIRPDRRVMEMGDYRYDVDIWQRAMLPVKEKDLIPTQGLDSKTFCNNAAFTQKPYVLNLGTTPVSTMNVDFIRNGEVQNLNIQRAIGIFEEAQISVPTINQFKETTQFGVVVKKIDDKELAENEQLKFDATYLRPLVQQDNYKIKFTTDFYPGEISWLLRDNKQRIIMEQKYNPGPEQWGGGGADAHATFTYDVLLEYTDITCLTLLISDSEGDGMTSFNASKPTPGVEIIAPDGTVLKPKMDDDYRYSTTKSIFSAFSLSSSSEDISDISHLGIYPNPVSETLKLAIDFKAETVYKVFVTDMLGRQVTPDIYNASFVQVGHLQQGLYQVNVQTKNGVSARTFSKI